MKKIFKFLHFSENVNVHHCDGYGRGNQVAKFYGIVVSCPFFQGNSGLAALIALPVEGKLMKSVNFVNP